jgi:hypothetical protein
MNSLKSNEEKRKQHNEHMRLYMKNKYHEDADAKLKSQFKYYKRLYKQYDDALEIMNNTEMELHDKIKMMKKYHLNKKIENI